MRPRAHHPAQAKDRVLQRRTKLSYEEPDNHHHGDSEAGIYVVSGHPVFVYHDGTQEVRISADPGDFLLVPRFVPHREENPDPNEPVVVVIARTTQEPIKVFLPELYQLEVTDTHR